MSADLHMHSRYSDGTFTPAESAALAHKVGLSALSLTDHDTVEGCDEMEKKCLKYGIEFIPGVELTAQIETNEVHILGYLMNIQYAEFLELVSQCQEARKKRIYEMVERLNDCGVDITPELVFENASCKSPGRPHVARTLVQAGICRNFDEAFEKYLKKNRPAWMPKKKISAQSAIDMIHSAGGVAVLAHPVLYKKDKLIPKLAEMGLDGLECHHSKQKNSLAEKYQTIAKELKLLPTGGSDCHGNSKGKPLIGTVRIPMQFVTDLKKRAQTYADHPPFF
ncbi:MAG TPA: PHP domain-containing protein [Verrucomicrobiales bacterium]|nr:PHP domain-containing protein [Verrucomicrobiales bacterium]